MKNIFLKLFFMLLTRSYYDRSNAGGNNFCEIYIDFGHVFEK